MIRERLGLEHVTFHGLRHFSATALAGQGVGVRTIAGRLGHANPNVTLRTYAHFLDVADREAASALGRLIGTLDPQNAPSRSRDFARAQVTLGRIVGADPLAHQPGRTGGLTTGA